MTARQLIREEAARRRIRFETLADYGQTANGRAPVLMLGYGQIAEAAIPAGIRELAEAIAGPNRPSSAAGTGFRRPMFRSSAFGEALRWAAAAVPPFTGRKRHGSTRTHGRDRSDDRGTRSWWRRARSPRRRGRPATSARCSRRG